MARARQRKIPAPDGRAGLGTDRKPVRRLRRTRSRAAGSSGATIWRWDLSLARPRLAQRSGVITREKLSCRSNTCRRDLLWRGDSVRFRPAASPIASSSGPGIRCVIEGQLRVDSNGHSHRIKSVAPGSKPAPTVFAQARRRPTRFRVMILPAPR